MNNMPPLTPKLSEKNSAIVRRWLPLIAGLAVGLRLAIAFLHPIGLPNRLPETAGTTTAWAGESGIFGDSVDYDFLARALLHHQPYRVNGLLATRMPGYPILAATIYALTGDSMRAVLYAQALMGGMIVLLAYAIARRFGTAAGLIAATLAAFDPLSLGFSATLLTETPFTLCLMLALWCGMRMMEKSRAGENVGWGWWISLGAIWGVGVYFRASALWAIMPLALWIGYSRTPVGAAKRSSRLLRSLAMGGLSLAIVFALLCPWLMRNYSLFHTGFFRLTTLEGISLYEAVYPDADGGPKQDKITLPPEMQSMNEAQRNDEWAKRGWQFVREDPGRILHLSLIKAGRTWSPFFHAAGFSAGPIQLGMALWYVPLFVFGLVGIVTGGRENPPLSGLLVIPLGYFTLVHALFLGSVRYRVPLMPVICIFAAIGMMNVGKWLAGAKHSTARAV